MMLSVLLLSTMAQLAPIKPDNEKTDFQVWEIVAGLWSVSSYIMQVSDIYQSNYEGFTVKETTQATGLDRCWYPGSLVLPATTVTGGKWVVQEFNIYNRNKWWWDYVGFSPGAVQYYRIERGRRGLPMPCRATIYQGMNINTGPGGTYVFYRQNTLLMEIYYTQVCSARDYAYWCNSWEK